MKRGSWTGLLLLAIPLLAGFGVGCGNFWQAPSSGNFALSNSGAIAVSAGATSGNTSTITVTPSNSFTGTVALTCAVTTSISNPVSSPTCSLSSTSVSITDTSAQTSTLTAATTSTTSGGTYQITVTGTSGSTTETTSVCVAVGSSAQCSGTAGSSGVFYVLNQTTNEIVALSVSSGQLNQVDAKTTPTDGPLAIAVAPNGKFLYVSTLSGIYLYTIASDGSLTIGNGDSVISSDPATTMQVDATNSWLVEAISGYATLNAINVVASGSSAGTLAVAGEKEQAFSLPATTVQQLAISPNDSSSCTSCYVFVAMGSGGTEAVHFNPGSANPFGNYGNLSVKNSSGGANTVAVDPSNRLLYVGESNALPSATQTGGLRALTIGSTGLNELAASPYSIGGTGPSSILPTANGSYVYVANRSVSGSSNGNIAEFSVTTSALTSIGTVAAGPAGLIGLAEDSNSSYVLAVDFAGGPDLDAYTMSSGALTSSFTSTTGTDPVGAVAIAALP